jgi:hypothetical protein
MKRETLNPSMQRTAGRPGSSLSLRCNPQPRATPLPLLILFSLAAYARTVKPIPNDNF